MLREIILLFIGIAIGSLMSGWSLWYIWLYSHLRQEKRRQNRLYFRIAIPVALIGFGDLFKSLSDLLSILTS